jgi:hypothetical protein
MALPEPSGELQKQYTFENEFFLQILQESLSKY